MTTTRVPKGFQLCPYCRKPYDIVFGIRQHEPRCKQRAEEKPAQVVWSRRAVE